jgi:hypothetical protein
MTVEIGHFRFSLPAGADLSGSQGLFVKPSSGSFVLAGLGEQGYVLQNKPAQGKGAEVEKVGLTVCISGAAIAADALVTSDAAGKGITAASGHVVNGRALTATSGADEEFTLDPHASGYAVP